MMTWTRTLRRVVGLGASKAADEDVQRAAATARRQAVERPPIDIAPNDPLLAYFAESRGAVSLDELQLESPAVQALRARGSKLVVPLISPGELIGLPDLRGWQFAAYYHAARQVGGDFYDFIELPDGKIALVIGDVTGHGVPAALVMATTRSILRSDAPRLVSPAAVLARANALLHGD